MPAVSKNQQQAMGIALKAKRENKVDELPDGPAKEMAKSMSEKELEKYASTEHKGLPEKIKEEEKSIAESIVDKWEHFLVINEEMLGVEPGEISPLRSEKEQREEIGGKKEKNDWSDGPGTVVNSVRTPMTANTRGSRVAEHYDPNSLDLLFEDEKKI